MRTSIPTTLAALLLVALQTEAHSDRIHARHDRKHRLGRIASKKIETATEYTTVMVTVTVQPLPVETVTIFPTVTNVVTAIFPPAASGSGTGVIGTGTGIPTNTTSEAFPPFTQSPVISIPSGTDVIIPTSVAEINSTSSGIVPTLTSFPVFTGSPVVSIPAGTDAAPVVASSSSVDEYSAPPAVPTFPAFTDAPVVDIPGASEPAPAPSSVVEKPSSSSPAPALTFPPFTESPMVVIPASTAQSVETTPTPEPSTPAEPVSGPLPFLRGVNLGGWLVLEKWMTEDLFSGDFSSAKDQYTFDSIPNSLSALENHWSTFFTESDISKLAAAGFNALRIPIGYWAYDNNDTPYHKGADAFLEEAIGWARNNNMKVLVDCHGSPGSQNGFDNSGQAGDAHWQESNNLDKSIDVLKTMAQKYGQKKYADVVIGLQLVNEPISWGNNNFDVTKEWTEKAYSAVKAEIENPDLLVVMHDAFQGGVAWESVASRVSSSNSASGSSPGANAFAIDEHLYQLFTDDFNDMNQDEHVAAACAWGGSLAASTAFQKTMVGEFSAATNICLMKDGSTIAGTSCSEDGCECQTGDWTKWSQGMKDQMRRFVEAQLEVFEANSMGYFAWSAKGPGGWGVMNLLDNGVWPQNGDKQFPGVCGGGKREVSGRSMRRGLRR